MVFTMSKPSFINRIRSTASFVRQYRAGFGRGALTFIDNSLVYLYGKKPRRGPMFVGWNLLFNCNATCSFCDTHALHEKLDREMTTDEALSVVHQLGKAGTWHLSLTGGETLMRRDLPDIIKAAKDYGMFVNVNTNGALLKKKAKRLVDAGLDSIIISLDSPVAEVHDTAREIPGLSDSIFKGIEAVREVQRETGSRKPEITLRMVVSKQNYEQVDEFIQKFKPLVEHIQIQPIHDGIEVPKFGAEGNLNLFNIKEEDNYQFELSDKGKFQKVMDGLIAKYKWLDTPFVRDFGNFIFDKNAMWDKYKCYAGYYYLVVDPALKTFPCTFFVKDTGSLREKDLMDIWRGDTINEWRRSVKNKENTCLCWCGFAEVNQTLTNHLEKKVFHPLTRAPEKPVKPAKPAKAA